MYSADTSVMTGGVRTVSFLPCRYFGKECEPEAVKEKLTVDVSEEMNVEAVRRALVAQLKPATSGFGPWKKTHVARAENVHFFVRRELFLKEDEERGQTIVGVSEEPSKENSFHAAGRKEWGLTPVTDVMSEVLGCAAETTREGKRNGQVYCSQTMNTDEEKRDSEEGKETDNGPNDLLWYYSVEGNKYGDDLLGMCELCMCCLALCACCMAGEEMMSDRKRRKQNPPSAPANNWPPPPPPASTTQYNYYTTQPGAYSGGSAGGAPYNSQYNAGQATYGNPVGYGSQPGAAPQYSSGYPNNGFNGNSCATGGYYNENNGGNYAHGVTGVGYGAPPNASPNAYTQNGGEKVYYSKLEGL